MSRASSSALCLLTALFLFACTNGIHSKTGGSPVSTSPTPAEISSSDRVVKVSSSPVSIPQNGSSDAVVTLSISPGFHVNAYPPTFSYLIATEVKPSKAEGLIVGLPNYPAGGKKKFQFADQPLAVYEGEVRIKLNLRAEKDAAAGTRSLPITVRVQACDEQQCFPPATLNSTIRVDVK
jgi:thioredoxin:protein disulfide reductase